MADAHSLNYVISILKTRTPVPKTILRQLVDGGVINIPTLELFVFLVPKPDLRAACNIELASRNFCFGIIVN